MPSAPSVTETRFRGEPAIELRAGNTSAMFLPHLGMTGVSLRFRQREYLALPGGLPALRAGTTLGLPLLAPWANRLATRRYRAGGTIVDLAALENQGLRLSTDDHGLPIHGFLVGKPGWRIVRTGTRADSARVTAAIDVDAPAFPFPHRIDLVATLRDGALRIATTVVPTGRRRVPVAFGWHPYLQLPGTPRREWELRLPARTHLVLDTSGIPTGDSRREPAQTAPIGRRTFDDAYHLRRQHRLAFATERAAVEMHCDASFPYGQVWVPPGRTFAALEPMTAPTNALVEGTAPLVAPGDTFTASFWLLVA